MKFQCPGLFRSQNHVAPYFQIVDGVGYSTDDVRAVLESDDCNCVGGLIFVTLRGVSYRGERYDLADPRNGRSPNLFLAVRTFLGIVKIGPATFLTGVYSYFGWQELVRPTQDVDGYSASYTADALC